MQIEFSEKKKKAETKMSLRRKFMAYFNIWIAFVGRAQCDDDEKLTKKSLFFLLRRGPAIPLLDFHKFEHFCQCHRADDNKHKESGRKIGRVISHLKHIPVAYENRTEHTSHKQLLTHLTREPHFIFFTFNNIFIQNLKFLSRALLTVTTCKRTCLVTKF